jgi:hypothetical protein
MTVKILEQGLGLVLSCTALFVCVSVCNGLLFAIYTGSVGFGYIYFLIADKSTARRQQHYTTKLVPLLSLLY